MADSTSARLAARTVTLAPGCSLSMPSMTTVSPDANPEAMEVLSPSLSLTSTLRASTLLSGLTTYT